jgi:hypothetical protein
MRLTTIASAAILGLSTAAIAQVATTPIEQKGEASNAALGNVTANLVAEPTTNTTETATPAAGDPAASTDAPKK